MKHSNRSVSPQDENKKDWGNPAFIKIYLALAMADAQNGEEIVNWLNHNGFANLTCCPSCHVDDFVHVQSCPLNEAMEMMYKAVAVTAVRGNFDSTIRAMSVTEVGENLRKNLKSVPPLRADDSTREDGEAPTKKKAL